MPAAICQAQLTTTVALSGAGLSPLYEGALATGKLDLPAISLGMIDDINGVAATGTPVALPDDPTMPAASQVRWTSQTQMSFDVTPDLMLPVGLYDVVVTNANGKKGTFPGGLLAVPPPTLTSVVTDLVCGERENIIELAGDFFITSATSKPTVKIGTLPFEPGDVSNCRTLPGGSGLSACKTIKIKLLSGQLAPGNYPVTVTNPAPVGCASTQTATLTVVPAPVITVLQPDLACTADGDVSVTITGTGFLNIDGKDAGVAFGGMSLPGKTSQCAPLTGPREVVNACTTVTFSIPKNTAGGAGTVAVLNPDPAGCMSGEKPLVLFDRPTVTSVRPSAICSQTPTVALTITGTSFVTVGTTVPSVKIATKTYVPTASACTDVVGPTETTKICTTLTVTVAPPDLPTGKQTVVITNPAPVGCASVGGGDVEITTPPVLTAVVPGRVCAGDATLNLTGTNFATTATVTLNGVAARTVTVAGGGTTAVAEFGGGLPPGGPYSVTISNGAGCDSTLPNAVTVVPGPQVFFVDPDVIYNGINVQATLYGTGFTNPVTAVEISSNGTTWTPVTFTQDVAKPNRAQLLIPKGTAAGKYAVRLTDSSGAGCKATLGDAFVATDKLTLALAAPATTPSFGWTMQSAGITVNAQATGSGFLAVPRVYLNPTTSGPTAMATPLGAVAFIDKTHLTALVPAALPVGAYDVIVVNPDGTVGVATGAFNVTAAPPPRIASLSPGSVTNATGQTFIIVGENFRQPTITLACVDSGGNALPTNPTVAASAASATSVTATFDASAAGAACIVRVTDGDDKTFDDFSALVITNPAANLYAAKDGPSLLTARRAPAAVDGHASNAARYLYIVGGDDGAGAAFDTVEAAPLGLSGVPGTFAVQRNKLTRPRAFAGATRIDRFIYVAGGSNGNTRHDTIERAAVLNPDERGEVTDLLLDVADTGLAPGVWYYRVAAVMASADPFNPDGENLPSDPFPVRVPDLQNKKLQVTVSWHAQIGAAKYRVYRSTAPGATVGTEQLLAEVAAPTTDFKDTGGAPMATDTPMPVGSLGRWQALAAKLSVAREGAGVAWAIDPTVATQAYVYALGGRQDAGTALASYDILGLTLGGDGSQTATATVTAVPNAIGTARWQLSASSATHQLSPRIAAGTTYVFALSGVAANGTTLVKDAVAAPVKAGGALGPFVDINGAAGLGNAGYGAVVAGDYVFAFGGSNAAPDSKVVSGQLCTNCNRMGMTVGAPYVVNFNGGQDMRQARYLLGSALSGAFIYVAGGVTVAGTPPQLSKTTEYRLW